MKLLFETCNCLYKIIHRGLSIPVERMPLKYIQAVPFPINPIYRDRFEAMPYLVWYRSEAFLEDARYARKEEI